MSQVLRLSLFVVSLVACLASPSLAQDTPSRRFQTLLDESWEFDLREDPLFATQTGDDRYDHLLSRETLADQDRRHLARQGFQARLKEIERAKLSPAEQVNYDIFGRLLREQIAEHAFQSHLAPISGRSGFHIEFAELPKQVPLTNPAQYRKYIARLAAFETYAGDHIELMRAGMKAGIVLPAVVLEGYREPLAVHVEGDAAKSLFFAPFVKFPESVPPAEREALSTAARQAIESNVVPGYRKFLEFMEREYVPAARTTVGAAALPKGREFYRHRVRKFTTLDLSPEQVHETGLAEVKRIKTEMQGVIAKTGFQGDFAAFVAHLRSDPKFYPETPEQLMKEVSFVLKRMDGELPRLFKRLPRAPYGIREVPAYIAPRTTTAYYQVPAGDGSRAGFYFVNTYNLKSRPLFEVEALSLHEAVPGHHLQLALQQELTDLPKFRRFSGCTAFIEGWGLYSERLGLEVGFYQDPYRDFGRLSYEMWRACRLVVDTGIHHFGWTKEQAVDFMAVNTALSLHNIRAEVDRYIGWPGQALAYKTGELKIRELRRRAGAEVRRARLPRCGAGGRIGAAGRARGPGRSLDQVAVGMESRANFLSKNDDALCFWHRASRCCLPDMPPGCAARLS